MKYIPRRAEEPSTIEDFNAILSQASYKQDIVAGFSAAARMKELGIEPDSRTYSRLLNLLAQNDLGEEAFALLADMKASGIQPDVRCYNVVLMATAKDLSLQARVLEEMRQAGVKFNARTHEIRIRRYIAEQNAEMCLQELQTMYDNGMVPAPALMERIFVIVARRGLPRLALDLVHAFEHGTDNQAQAQVWVHILISSVKQYYEEGVAEAYSRLKADKIDMHEGLLIELLHHAAHSGNVELAEEVVERLKGLKVTLGEQHLAPLTEAYGKKGKFARVLAIFDELRSLGIEPTAGMGISFYRAVVPERRLRQSTDSLDSVLAMVEEWKKDGKPLHTVALNAIVKATATYGQLKRAEELYRSFASFGATPNADTFDALLIGSIQSENPSLTNDLFNRMKDEGITLSERTFERMITTSLKQTPYEAAFHWLEEMKSVPFKPSASTYAYIVKKLVYKNDPRAKAAFDEMEAQGYEISYSFRHWVETGGKERPQDDNLSEGEPTRRRVTDRTTQQKERQPTNAGVTSDTKPSVLGTTESPPS
ncbi:hypothetical protein FRB99_008780 [Tulasnella sp. 403]|nr:hypothetical protein FRB99_008780 [Tulasnella sp. 403]